MLTPRERYLRDPQFKTLVDVMVGMICKAHFTPTELREAAILAAIIYESTSLKQYIFNNEHDDIVIK